LRAKSESIWNRRRRG